MDKWAYGWVEVKKDETKWGRNVEMNEECKIGWRDG